MLQKSHIRLWSSYCFVPDRPASSPRERQSSLDGYEGDTAKHTVPYTKGDHGGLVSKTTDETGDEEGEEGAAHAGTCEHDPAGQPASCGEPFEENRSAREVGDGCEGVENSKGDHELPWLFVSGVAGCVVAHSLQ